MKERKVKVLFVAMPFSIHTVRWINQLRKTNWDIHFYSSFDYAQPHSELQEVTYHSNLYKLTGSQKLNVKSVDFGFEPRFKNRALRTLFGKLVRLFKIESSPVEGLLKVINKVHPDIIHSLETQHAGYLVADVIKSVKNKPYWIHSTWGIDFHFFSQLEAHHKRIDEVIKNCDHLIVEGTRDFNLARTLGYFKSIDVIPSVGGGFEKSIFSADHFIIPSERKIILLKGTQDIIRRSLFALRALENCVDILDDFNIIIHAPSEEIRIASELLKKKYAVNIEVREGLTHEEMLELTGLARISITNNLSDGMPNSMLEAMAMGAFPIQSNTSCASDLIVSGKNGYLVDPENITDIEGAIRSALENDILVDNAATQNQNLISEILDYDKTNLKIVNIYKAAIR